MQPVQEAESAIARVAAVRHRPVSRKMQKIVLNHEGSAR